MQKRLHVFFNGMVQGVGFRFTAERISRHFEVMGFIRNLSSGQVEIVAEGEESVLKDFLEAIRESPMAPYIQSVDSKWSEARGGFTKFDIVL